MVEVRIQSCPYIFDRAGDIEPLELLVTLAVIHFDCVGIWDAERRGTKRGEDGRDDARYSAKYKDIKRFLKYYKKCCGRTRRAPARIHKAPRDHPGFCQAEACQTGLGLSNYVQ